MLIKTGVDSDGCEITSRVIYVLAVYEVLHSFFKKNSTIYDYANMIRLKRMALNIVFEIKILEVHWLKISAAPF